MCTVRDLTQFLLDWRGRLEPPRDPEDTNRDILTLPLVEDDPRQPLFRALRDLLAPTFHNPEQIDFEMLIHLCEQLATLFPIPQEYVIDRYRSLVAPFINPSAAAQHYNLPSLIFAVQDACYELLNRVTESCNQVSCASHPQAQGLARLARVASLAVHSLNYDDIPYESGVEFYDGFDRRTGAFQPVYPWPRSKHTLCQLHGSVRWGMSDFPESELRWFASRTDAAATRRNTRRGPGQFMDRHSAADAPIITGLRKADRILARPYGTYFHVCRDDLLRIPNWLIIGYGFRDQHVNNMLSQACNNWKQRGIKQRIVVVDYHPFLDTDASGCEVVRHGWPAAAFLDRILGATFRNELIAFMAPLKPTLQRNMLNRISEELAVWLDGSGSAFTSGLDAIMTWMSLS